MASYFIVVSLERQKNTKMQYGGEDYQLSGHEQSQKNSQSLLDGKQHINLKIRSSAVFQGSTPVEQGNAAVCPAEHG